MFPGDVQFWYETLRSLGHIAYGGADFGEAGPAFAADSLHINVQEDNLTLPKAVNGNAVLKTLHINVAHDLQGTCRAPR